MAERASSMVRLSVASSSRVLNCSPRGSGHVPHGQEKRERDRADFRVASRVRAGDAGVRARAEIAKARGDKARALADFEALAASVDDASVRLELAKLYEHHAKDAARWLQSIRAAL